MTYVVAAQERLLGFATVSVGSRERKTLPSARLRRRLPAYALPVPRLARLGVDLHAQGQGVGSALLRHVLSLALEQRGALGCIGVVTDAKPEALAFYARYGFEPLEGVREGALHGGPVPLFLPLGAVAEARDERGAARLSAKPGPPRRA